MLKTSLERFPVFVRRVFVAAAAGAGAGAAGIGRVFVRGRSGRERAARQHCGDSSESALVRERARSSCCSNGRLRRRLRESRRGSHRSASLSTTADRQAAPQEAASARRRALARCSSRFFVLDDVAVGQLCVLRGGIQDRDNR